jgi:hypothetical protein
MTGAGRGPMGATGRKAKRGWALLAASTLALAAPLLAGCGGAATGGAGGAGAPLVRTAAPPTRLPGAPLSLDAAALVLADALLSRADSTPPGAAGGGRALAIDPFIDRATGTETAATRAVVARITGHVRGRHPRFALRPLTVAGLADRPLVLLGAISAGAPRPAAARRGPTGSGRCWPTCAPGASSTPRPRGSGRRTSTRRRPPSSATAPAGSPTRPPDGSEAAGEQTHQGDSALDDVGAFRGVDGPGVGDHRARRDRGRSAALRLHLACHGWLRRAGRFSTNLIPGETTDR